MVQVSVVLPTWNEAGCIRETLSRVCGQLHSDGLSFEVLVVDDESTDGTQAFVEEFGKTEPGVRLVRHPAPHCFGFSVRDGVRQAAGELVVVMMADLSDDPRFIKPMWDKFAQGFDVVVGSRFVPGAHLSGYSPLKMLSNRLFNWTVQIFFLMPIKDTSNNFKAFRASLARKVPLTSQGFEAGAELMLRMVLSGAKACEIPVSWADRTSGTAKFRLSRMFLRYFVLFLRMLKLAYFDRFFGKRV